MSPAKRLSIHILATILITSSMYATSTPSLIMLDPAGHAKQPGRQLVSSLERAETYKCAEALKTALEQNLSQTRIILTRTPGEEMVPLQAASFSNRLEADFFLRIHCYKEVSDKPHIYIYHEIIDPLLDTAQRLPAPFVPIPIGKAHYRNSKRSAEIARLFHQSLSSSDYQNFFECHRNYGLPLKPLIGIVAPAIAIEIGLTSDDQWNIFIAPLVETIKKIFNIQPVSEQTNPV